MIKNYLNVYMSLALVGFIPLQTSAAIKGSQTLPVQHHIKNHTDSAVGYFQSKPLKTDQGHKATGEQSFDLSVNSDSDFPIRVEGHNVSPGQTVSLTKGVNGDGELIFEVIPLISTGETGKTDYEVTIDNLYSNLDRFWSAHTPTYTAWLDTGQRVDYFNWNPAVARQMANFTQTQTHSEVWSHMRQDREIDSNVGEVRNVGSPVEETEKRPITNTRNIVASSNAYNNVGGHYDCAEWTPAEDEVYQGLMADQLRDCKQNQSRTWLYKLDSTTIHSHDEGQTTLESESQSVPGTKDPWLTAAASLGGWYDDSAAFGHTPWTPAIDKQTADFDQTRNYKQPQSQTKQPRQQNAVTNAYRNVGAQTLLTRNDLKSESRTINVEISNWVNTGNPYSCSAWSPATNTVAQGTSFTQSQNCSQMQVKTWTYKHGSATVASRAENKVGSSTPTRSATGTKVVNGTWVNIAKDSHTQPQFALGWVQGYLGFKPAPNNQYDCRTINGQRYCAQWHGSNHGSPGWTCKVGDKHSFWFMGHMSPGFGIAYMSAWECK